jgi:hypothetical protein
MANLAPRTRRECEVVPERKNEAARRMPLLQIDSALARLRVRFGKRGDRNAANEKSFQVIDLEGLILVAGIGFEPMTFRL